MIPAVFIELQRMPFLSSGKIDRIALPSPSLGSLAKRRTVVHGRTEIEKGLISIWQEVLELYDVSINDNFFDLGGHSLSGLRVLARVRRDFHVDVPIRGLFEAPTIAELALEVEKLKGQDTTVLMQVLQADWDGTFAPIARHAPCSSALLNIVRAELGALSTDQMDAILQSVLAEKNARSSDKNRRSGSTLAQWNLACFYNNSKRSPVLRNLFRFMSCSGRPSCAHVATMLKIEVTTDDLSTMPSILRAISRRLHLNK
jgi:acyl carrier protein